MVSARVSSSWNESGDGPTAYALDEFGDEDFRETIDGMQEIEWHLGQWFGALLRCDLSFGLRQVGFGREESRAWATGRERAEALGRCMPRYNWPDCERKLVIDIENLTFKRDTDTGNAIYF